MSTATYRRYELLRTIRNRRVMIFSIAFPVILYLAIAVPAAMSRISSGPGYRRRCTSWSAWRPSAR
jgi:hypothetical protein